MSAPDPSPQLRKKYQELLVSRQESSAFLIALLCGGGGTVVVAALGVSASVMMGLFLVQGVAIIVGVEIAKSKKKKEVEAMPDDRLLHEYEEARIAQTRSWIMWALGLAIAAIVLVLTPRGNALLNSLVSQLF